MTGLGRLRQFTAPKKLILYWRNHIGMGGGFEIGISGGFDRNTHASPSCNDFRLLGRSK